MHPHLFSSSSFIIIIFLVLPLCLCDDDDDKRFSDCTPTFNCGNIPGIGYPFWGNGRPNYCGHPEFELDCHKDYATIKMMEQSYRVMEIKPESQILKIARTDFTAGNCPSKFVNTTLNYNLFDNSPDYMNLALFYGCNFLVPLPNWFKCHINGVPDENAYIKPEMLPVIENGGICNVSIVVPVLPTDIPKAENPANLIEVLRKGFEVKWKVDSTVCKRCTSSGGRCGYDMTSNHSTCFCPNQSYGSTSTTCSTSTPNLMSAPLAPPPESGRRFKPMKLIAGLAGGVGGIILTCLLFFLYRRRQTIRQNKSKNISPSSTLLSENISSYTSSKMDLEKGSRYFGVPIFSYEELVEATDNFNPSKELGDGGFGTVYHGKLRDGRVVAVKRLYENNYKRVEQFMNEVEILTRLRHQNLVTLYGCTSRRSRELLLVYEYIPNGTVADHLHGEGAKAGSLTWPFRMSIAIETAEALAYLHASDIIHRDIKTNNILLDNNFRVKVADFGLSRLFPMDVTHVSTAPQGTPGYVDPEYHQCYQLTDRSDVYSFGVVLIELISSKPAVDINRHRHEINLANMAINKIQNRSLHELIDPCLWFDSDCAVRRRTTLVAELAFRCLQQERDMRPSMDEVLEVLRGIENEDYKVEKTEEADIPADDVGLLKSIPPPLSPDSVTDKWGSRSTTPNASS